MWVRTSLRWASEPPGAPTHMPSYPPGYPQATIFPPVPSHNPRGGEERAQLFCLFAPETPPHPQRKWAPQGSAEGAWGKAAPHRQSGEELPCSENLKSLCKQGGMCDGVRVSLLGCLWDPEPHLQTPRLEKSI